MSAIFGLLRFDGADASASELERMSAVLAHRGPDGRRCVTTGALGLGHCLLRVNQEDLFEAQPLHDAAADLTLVADGRIDNREALAADLAIAPETLRDMPDSAVILAAYKAWGEAAPERLIGDFTFALWDGRARKLVLARDHMGQRYVFYHHCAGFFAFSTEIKGLWAVEGVPRRLSEAEIGGRMMPRADSERVGGSLYDEVMAIPGATVLTVSAGGLVASRSYWRPHGAPAHLDRDPDHYLAAYREVLEEAVACRLRRLTRPAALLLSAGFDSAAIAGLAGPVAKRQGRKLVALAAVVPDTHRGSRFDIRPWVEACRRTMPHLDVRYSVAGPGSPLAGLQERFLRNDAMASVVDQRLHPIFAEAAGAGARLLIDGVGGDYTINPRGAGALAWLLRAGRLRDLLAEIDATMRTTGQTRWQVIRREVIGKSLPRRLLTWLYHGDWARPGEHPVNERFLARLLRERRLTRQRPIGRIPISAMRALSLHMAIQHCGQSRPSRATPAASYGLELTRPMVDKRVVEFGLAVPEALYFKHGRNRYLARAALADVYPPEILSRSGFNEPAMPDLPDRMEAAMPELRAEAQRLSANPRLAAYIDFAKLRRLLQPPGSPTRPPNQRKRRFAVYALMLARHFEWLAGDNRP